MLTIYDAADGVLIKRDGVPSVSAGNRLDRSAQSQQG